MRRARLQMAAATDQGRLRGRNEDSIGLDRALGAAVVADGMGGLPDGHVASREAVDAILAHLKAAGPPLNARTLEAALAGANERVRARAQVADTIMGTTAVVLGVDGDVWRIAHVGDSRAYRFHDGKFSLVTRDHSMVQEMVSRGVMSPAAARRSPDRNVITRAIGLESVTEVDCTEIRPRPDELVLLCSDGLWDMLEDDHIAELLAGCGSGVGGLERCVESLVSAANEAGGVDNISVILVRA